MGEHSHKSSSASLKIVYPGCFFCLLWQAVRTELLRYAAPADVQMRTAEKFVETVVGKVLQPEEVTTAVLVSIQALLSQREFVLGFLLASSGLVPVLLGTCGHVYAVESVPVNRRLSGEFLARAEWPERAAAALAYLNFVDRLSSLQLGTLHMCDVQPTNFGLQPIGGGRFVVKAIDIDISFFGAELEEVLPQGDGSPLCRRHSECDFYDCQGVCNVVTGRCSTQRRDTNLQVCPGPATGYGLCVWKVEHCASFISDS